MTASALSPRRPHTLKTSIIQGKMPVEKTYKNRLPASIPGGGLVYMSPVSYEATAVD